MGYPKTQGSHLYFINPTGTPALVKLTCPTGITGMTGGAADQIDSTCLDETHDKTFEKGLNSPVAVSVPFNLNTADASHKALFALKETGQTLKWLALLSESATAPTLVANAIVPPVDRTSFAFSGYISEVNLDVSTNEIVRGTLTIQRSGGVTPTWVT